MSAAIVLHFPDDLIVACKLADVLGAEHAEIGLRQFPDGESQVVLPESPAGRAVIVCCSLVRPDPKLAPLLFAADAARDLGAQQVGLVAPYLAYMRQDRRFQAGEAITSRTFARLLSSSFDWLATVDPHLHRYAALDEIYTIPSRVIHAAPLIGRWIGANVSNPLILGPDAESEQWVAEVAKDIGAPYAVFTKTRLGDRSVRIDPPDLGRHVGRQPVLVDDIVSSGRTLIEAARCLASLHFAKPVCVVTHALFAEDAYAALSHAAASIVSCNSVMHPSNAIDVSTALGMATNEFMSVKQVGRFA